MKKNDFFAMSGASERLRLNRFLLLQTGLAAMCWTFQTSAVAQQGDTAHVQYANCVQEMYESRPRLWYGLRNLCGEAVLVQFRANHGSTPVCDGTAVLQPRQAVNLGKAPPEILRCGGMALAVCPLGYAAVDLKGKAWGHGAGREYRCEQTIAKSTPAVARP